MNELTEIKPSLLRKYLFEYALIALSGCVIYLFIVFNNLNTFIRNDLMKQNNEVAKTIQENTEALKNFKNNKP